MGQEKDGDCGDCKPWFLTTCSDSILPLLNISLSLSLVFVSLVLSLSLSCARDTVDESQSFDGVLDELRLWNKTLSSSTVASNMNKALPRDTVGISTSYTPDSPSPCTRTPYSYPFPLLTLALPSHNDLPLPNYGHTRVCHNLSPGSMLTSTLTSSPTSSTQYWEQGLARVQKSGMR